MFFRKKKLVIEDQDKLPQIQLENALNKYVTPELVQRGFRFSKDEEYPWFYYDRKFNDTFNHQIRIAMRDQSVIGGAKFNFEWIILSPIYEEFNRKEFNDLGPIPELISWDDISFDTVYKKERNLSFGSLYEYVDLSDNSTQELMNQFLKNLNDCCIPMLEEKSNWKSILEFFVNPYWYLSVDKIVDVHMLNNDLKNAGSVLFQAEKFAEHNPTIETRIAELVPPRIAFIKRKLKKKI